MASFDPQRWAESLMPGQIRQLFDHLPGTMFFAKDRQFRLVMGNPAFVARCGYQREADIIGLTDEDIFPASLAEKYRQDDKEVLRRAKPMHDLIELFPDAAGHPEWFVTDKLPLFGRDGKACGLCGTVRSYEGQRRAIQPYLELAAAADAIKASFREPLDVGKLAKMSNLSVRQFGRKFRATFRMSPRAFLMQVRVMRACEMLLASDLPITDIALATGFYDHSDLARQFAKRMGMTPSAYRRGAS